MVSSLCVFLHSCSGVECPSDDSTMRNCTCNTMYYNICAACVVCQGGDQPTWPQWAQDKTCDSDPASFPSQAVQLDQGMVPGWAHQPLSSFEDFNLTGALALTTPQSGMSKAAQIAVPIAVGVGVAILAGALFWCYRRHKWRHQRNTRMKILPLIPGEGLFAYPQRWLRETWLSRRSHRLRPSRKDSNWEIDEDRRRLNRSGSTSYYDPYSPPDGADREEHELGVPHTSPHIRETSSTSLLSNIELPSIRRWPTAVERFIKFKDGIRKSASYKAKYVSPIFPDPAFRIDGSAGNTPVANGFNAEGTRSQNPADSSLSIPSFHPHRVSTVQEEEDEDSSGGAPVVVQREDYDPQRPNSGEVLVISHDGEDFNSEYYTTPGPSSPRTPSTARQVSALLRLLPFSRAPFLRCLPFPSPSARPASLHSCLGTSHLN
ncbi:hypothetical protein BD311DRAFT_790953 [Dichomitus squalens]|uniref:Uncharacterized protein n=1 Tax=Dichomitus squalens TaxID=114155 RepID=A0A4V2JZB8_9APHY|nr:hypothetical protein BD311DRAFT_790953 [Dichomitus squalens]